MPLILNLNKRLQSRRNLVLIKFLDDVYALVDTENVKLFKEKNSEMDKELKELFDVSILRSKLEQFYTMLFYISKYTSIEEDELFLDRDSTIKLLISSEVFTNREFPRRITKVHLTRHNREKPSYKVFFDSDRVELDLNWGDDFDTMREGMNQEAKALVFYGSFSFRLRKREKTSKLLILRMLTYTDVSVLAALLMLI